MHAVGGTSGRADEMATEELPSPSPTENSPSERTSGTQAHRPIVHFRLFEQLKQRNVFRVAILYLVVCWLILEPVHVVFHMLEVPTWANRLVLMLMAVGFPAAVIFAWVYEITPDGLKPTVEVPHGQSIRKRTGRRLNRAIIGVLAVALAYFVVDRLLISRHFPASERAGSAVRTPAAPPYASIAVLAFADMSPSRDQEYFSDGMAEEILDALAKIEGLKVAGRTSSFSFKGKNADLKAIGEALGVAHILEGSVRKQDDRVRISAQLARASDGFHVWSHEYDGTLADIFDLQERIAREIASQLKVVLADKSVRLAPKVTDNTAAYVSFVEAQGLIRGRAELPRAVDLLTEATTLDPQFARGWSSLAVANAIAPMYSRVAWTPAWAAGEAAARRAMTLDPGNAESYAALGYIYLSQRRYTEMVGAFDRALQLDANDPTALFWASNALFSMGRETAGEALVDRVLKSDPLHPVALWYKGFLLQNKGDADAATQFAMRCDALGYRLGRVILSLVVSQRGDLVAGAEDFAVGWGAINSDFTAQDLVAIFRGVYGDAKTRAAALAIVDAHARDPQAPTMFLYLYQPEKAFAAFDQYGSGLSDSFFNWLWASTGWSRYARQHPAFQSFARRNGMVDYWKKFGWPDVCHAAPKRGPDAFDCD
jgi:TolB-like protein/tetratricopeptide (TPR) repeat protein